jgi:hypothetical protein
MAPAPHYEPGMNFTYDEKSGKVSVAFRGRIVVLSETYATENYARAAAESFCKRQGWAGKENADPRSLLRFRRAG